MMRIGRSDLSGQPVLPSVSLSTVRSVLYIPSFAVALTNNSAEVIVLFLVWCVAHRTSEVETGRFGYEGRVWSQGSAPLPRSSHL